uniref:Uncharacterized protein n=1 Tax=Sciurus vulgaris TaxID=55149 RepID=A0A8D2AX50_SCIVU
MLGKLENHTTPIAQEIKARINNWDRFKLKSFLSGKETISNVKREPTEWENIFATHTSDTALISRIYKELKKLYTKNTNNPINKWAKEMNRHFTEDLQAINRYLKKCSTSLVIREMQIKTTLRFHLTLIRMAQWCTPIVPATYEVEAGESLEPMSSRLA